MTPGTTLKEQTLQLAEAQKSVGAERISSVAGAVHDVAQVLEGEMPQAATYVHDAANQIEHAASELKERSIDELLSGVGSFARRHPLTFFGGTLLAGLVISRFLKSSANSRNM